MSGTKSDDNSEYNLQKSVPSSNSPSRLITFPGFQVFLVGCFLQSSLYSPPPQMNSIGLFPDTTSSLCSCTLSTEVHTFPVTEVIRTLISGRIYHFLSGQSLLKKPYILQSTTQISFSHSVLPSSLHGQPSRTTLVCLADVILWLPHRCHWTLWKNQLLTLHLYTMLSIPKSLFSIFYRFSLFFKPGQVMCHGKVQSERKRGSSTNTWSVVPDNKIRMTKLLLRRLSKSLFLFCASRDCLVQSVWAQIMSSPFIYQGALW